jgi:type III pantothenate kinase
MILTLDVGNSQIYGGVFDKNSLKLKFRRTSKSSASSDEIGVFLRSVLRENGIEHKQIERIAICSVVPDVVHSLRNACKKYFSLNPFVLQAGVKTGLKINYRNPLELGSDRIANSMAAVDMFPKQNIIIVDLGTATTFCAIDKDKNYLGGLILAGLRLSMEALERETARLPSVEIVVPESTLGRSTVENIQAGLFFGHVGAIKEITYNLSQECFAKEEFVVIGTGGFSSLLDRFDLFDVIEPDLILKGILLSYKMNSQPQREKYDAHLA